MSTCPNWTVAPVIAGLVGNLSAKINRLKEYIYIITNQQHPQYGSSLRRFLFGSCGIKKSVIHASVCLPQACVFMWQVHRSPTHYVPTQLAHNPAFTRLLRVLFVPTQVLFISQSPPAYPTPQSGIYLRLSVLCVSHSKAVIRSIFGVMKPSPRRVLFGGITKPVTVAGFICLSFM